MSINPHLSVSIGILNYKTKHILTRCVSSVFSQKTSYLFTVYVSNNSPKEDLTSVLKSFPKVIIRTYEKNAGFCKGHNDIISASSGTYYFCLNADVTLEPDYVQCCVDFMEKNPRAGAVTGKLLWYDEKNHTKTHIIDSTGISNISAMRFVDRGMGENDTGQYDNVKSIFGVSGAAAMYRKTALEDVKDRHGYFDERFFSYKEDIDLSIRLQKNGWGQHFLPSAIGYHSRGTGLLPNDASLLKRMMHKKSSSLKTTWFSFRNTMLLFLKHIKIFLTK